MKTSATAEAFPVPERAGIREIHLCAIEAALAGSVDAASDKALFLVGFVEYLRLLRMARNSRL